MNTRNFEVLYTHQKLKKAKTWQDGCLKLSCNGTKAVLYDDQKCSLEVFHIHSNKVFPGSDVECERYLISVVDETISLDKGSSCDQPSQDIMGSRRPASILPTARTDHPGLTWRKRKREFSETFRPNLPPPDQDYEPPEDLKPRSSARFKRTFTNNHGLPKPTISRSSLSVKRNNFPDENYGPRVNRSVDPSRGEISFHSERNFKTSCFAQRNFCSPVFVQDLNFENSSGGCEALDATVDEEEGLISHKRGQATMQNAFPAPKRNRSELLSLFGGRKNMAASGVEEQGLFSSKTNKSPTQNYLTEPDSNTISNKKLPPSTKNLFCQSFDVSLGDEDDFLDNSFQTLHNPNSDGFIPSAASKPTSLPLESNVSAGNPSICVNNYNFDVDNGQDVFRRHFERNSFPRTCDLENKNRSFDNPAAVDSGSSSTRGYRSSPGWEFDESCVRDGGILDKRHDDLENDFVLSDNFDDAELSAFNGLYEKPQSSLLSAYDGNFNPSDADNHSDQSSLRESAFQKQVNNISVQNNLLSRAPRMNNRFTPPLISISNADKHVIPSSSSQVDLKASSFERATIESASRTKSYSGELYFPSSLECSESVTPTRQMTITTKFSSAMDYKCVLKSALREHLNIILFELAQKYHGILGKADIISSDDTVSDEKENVKGPSCTHGPGKLRAVKKDGPNKGRHFYTCPGSGPNQCKFFQWADVNHSTSIAGNKKISLTSSDSIRTFFKSKGIYFYHNCIMERRLKPTKCYGKKYSRKGVANEKKVMYIMLKYRDSSSLYTKDDIWIISKNVNFDPKATFVAKSLFYGPSSNGDLEIEPISGYSPSNWRSGDTVHAIWACNAGTELSCIQNIDEHVSLQQMPLLPYILNGSEPSFNSRRGPCLFSAPLSGRVDRNSLGIPWIVIEQEVDEIIDLYKLNPDQSTAIRSCAKMFVSEIEDGGDKKCLPITLIHGVFGAGKSFLLAVVVLLMVKLFEISDASDELGSRPVTWKILISSTTNVAVDRILLGLLELGFDQFVRVGSVRKIAKPVLPFSIHSVGTESQELKELQGMLKTELTSLEKAFVRKSIEMHKLGENRKRLANVRVVGVTCAACTFPSLERLKFPVLLLDECSQMTEPTSLLPIARFGCKKLVLVGDPKQLSPTIQGSEPAHESGLEQTLFDRLMKMDIKPILLRMQYRCHPLISSISNRLFYNDQLLDGVNAEERRPLVNFIPTLCFYDVANGNEECSQDGSYFNTSEAKFVVTLIKSLLETEIEPKQIGVISQYKSQLTAITNSLSADGATSHKELAGIQISTVDAFQGGEKDVIILSCVRTKHIGFIDCERRTNVALTRAKRHLCIVGRGKMLSSNALWKKILDICRDSPQGFQSSQSYIKEWNERRPKTDGSSSGHKKRRISKKDSGVKSTPKASNEDARKSLDSDRTGGKRPASIELNEVFESNSGADVACGDNDSGNINGRLPKVISDNDHASEAFDENDDVINTNDDEFLNSDNGVEEIELLGDSQLNMPDNIDECCEEKQDLLGKHAENPAVDLDRNGCSSEYVFDDDFLLDNELCNLGY